MKEDKISKICVSNASTQQFHAVRIYEPHDTDHDAKDWTPNHCGNSHDYQNEFARTEPFALFIRPMTSIGESCLVLQARPYKFNLSASLPQWPRVVTYVLPYRLVVITYLRH